ncbi:cytochrome b N-terminal domain-containing protein [Metallosphaera hakonensis]|uniref:cytochrome b N-terminal domain-containing protein n=1 Tax=Metallosphaera hakonensis TaxID=79601 RepID=UPI000AD9FBB4
MYNVSYWLGALVIASFTYTAITGMVLLLHYDPGNALPQTLAIVNNVPYGAVILFSHLYGAYILIVLAYIHMFRNFFKGAYKRPRELQWVTGVLLLSLTLAVSFFGYTLIGSNLQIGVVDSVSSFLLRTGIPGFKALVGLLFGPGANAASSNNPVLETKFFFRILGWHVILAIMIGLLSLFHLILAERYGITPS